MDALPQPPTSFWAAAAHSIGGVFTSYWHHRQLILQMARRDVIGRYRGSILGVAWSFLTPLLMLLVYTFLFGVVFKARWGGGTVENRLDFALILFVGLIVHAVCRGNRAPGLIFSTPASKTRRFPLEIPP
jgi:lipopolysaccharide transport system permease protein